MTARLTDVELLGRLVSFDSTSRNSNLPIADFVCDYLDRPDVRIERNPSPAGDKVNLVIAIGPEVDPESRAGLTLSGHLDVVPAQEPEWRSDPFELTDAGDRLVGRGACDMKGFVALAVNAVAAAGRERLRHPLAVLLTYDEEVGTLGARHFVDSWPASRPLPRHTIVGEPTSLAAVRMHKGFTHLHIAIAGRSAHSGYPHLGHSAIEPAGRLISGLAQLRRELEQEPCPHGEHFGEVPFVALNIGQVHGGTAANIVPDRCEIEVSLRMLPEMESGPLIERARAVAAAALAGETWESEVGHDSPPLLLPETSDLYQRLCRLLGQHQTVAVSYATDGGWLQRGDFDCLLWGPGSIEVAHRPNEWMPKAEFRRASELLGKVVEAICAP